MDFSKYENKLTYKGPQEDYAVYCAFRAEDARIERDFETDLYLEHEVADNDRACAAFALAWKYGAEGAVTYSNALKRTADYFAELVELIK